MIKTESLKDGTLIRHYSDDENCSLLQVETDVVYKDAIDVVPCRYTYEEVEDGEAREEGEPGEVAVE